MHKTIMHYRFMELMLNMYNPLFSDFLIVEWALLSYFDEIRNVLIIISILLVILLMI